MTQRRNGCLLESNKNTYYWQHNVQLFRVPQLGPVTMKGISLSISKTSLGNFHRKKKCKIWVHEIDSLQHLISLSSLLSNSQRPTVVGYFFTL